MEDGVRMTQRPRNGARPEWVVPAVSMAAGFTLGIMLIVVAITATRHG